jgi:hypothetical protein
MPIKSQSKTQSQCSKILKYLKSGKALTPLKAMKLFNTMNLAQRIQNLEDAGNKIKVRMVKVDSGKRVAEYRM